MMKVRIGRLLYKTLGHIFPGGVGRRFRAFAGRLMFEAVGKELNLEKHVDAPSTLRIGDCSGIGENAYIQGRTSIGDYVMMAKNVRIFTRNHNFSRMDIPMSRQGTQEEKPVTIGNDVWIGDSVILLPGTKIGNGVIIGAGSVVRGTVPDYAIVTGNPAQVTGYREDRAESTTQT